jgi:hypothetical protein
VLLQGTIYATGAQVHPAKHWQPPTNNTVCSVLNFICSEYIVWNDRMLMNGKRRERKHL